LLCPGFDLGKPCFLVGKQSITDAGRFSVSTARSRARRRRGDRRCERRGLATSRAVRAGVRTLRGFRSSSARSSSLLLFPAVLLAG
jgi:hypothetical protein